MTEEKPRRVEVTGRDIDILTWIGEQYCVRFDQLRRLLGQQAGPGAQQPGELLSESAARVWLGRMKALGAVEAEKVYHQEPAYVWLTAKGLRLADLEYSAARPAENTLHHCYWCNEVRFLVQARRPGATWRSERSLRRERALLEAERRRAGDGAGAGKHQAPDDVPDAEIQTESGTIAIEVELSPKKQYSRLKGVVSKRARKYYTVWYFCNDKTKKALERVKGELGEELRERVLLYDL